MKLIIAFIFVLYKTPLEDVDRLKKQFADANIYFIDNTNKEKGYAYGVNKGIKKALRNDANIIFIANPDISFEQVNIKKMIEASAHYDIWGFPFKQDGDIYYGGDIDSVTMAGGLSIRKPRQRFQSKDFISGSFMGIRKEVIQKIGFFDESYDMYYEDVDYCIRAKQAGFNVGLDRGIEYTHFELSKTNSRKKWLLARNRFRLMMKYGSTKQKFVEIMRLPLTIYRYFL